MNCTAIKLGEREKIRGQATPELQVKIYELRVQIYELRVQKYELRVQTYEFSCTS